MHALCFRPIGCPVALVPLALALPVSAQATGPLQFVHQGSLSVPGTTRFGKSIVLSGTTSSRAQRGGSTSSTAAPARGPSRRRSPTTDAIGFTIGS